MHHIRMCDPVLDASGVEWDQYVNNDEDYLIFLFGVA